MKINLEVPYRKQIAPVFTDTSRFRVVVAHRRCGKTVAAVQRLIVAALSPSPKKHRRFGYIAPFRNQAKSISWDYLKNMTVAIPGIDVNEAELKITFPNKSRIQLYGADNPNSLRGPYYDGVVLDEYATMNPVAWTQVLRPALSDRKGWAMWIGTPAGPNAFKKLYDGARDLEGWSRHLFHVDRTGLIDAEEKVALKREMDEDDYAQEYMCSFEAAVRGSYYGKLMRKAREDGRICSVPHEPGYPVETYWDLGMDDTMVIWFVQKIGAQTRVFDLYSNNGEGIAHYVRELQNKPYVYSRHVAPHDISVRELGTGVSRYETARELGLTFDIAPQLAVADGIEAVRRMIPSCWFDEAKCEIGINALQLYRKKFDEKLQTFQKIPLHSWESHYADAMRTGAVVSGYLAEHHYEPDVLAAFPDKHERSRKQQEPSWNEPIPYR